MQTSLKTKKDNFERKFYPPPQKINRVFFARPCIVYNRLTLLSSIESENKKIGMD